MAKVAVAVLGANLRPCHAVRACPRSRRRLRPRGAPRETRPSRPAVELVEGCEERLAGNHVDVEARLLVVPVFVGEGALGPVSLRDAVLLGGTFETAARSVLRRILFRYRFNSMPMANVVDRRRLQRLLRECRSLSEGVPCGSRPEVTGFRKASCRSDLLDQRAR